MWHLCCPEGSFLPQDEDTRMLRKRRRRNRTIVEVTLQLLVYQENFQPLTWTYRKKLSFDHMT